MATTDSPAEPARLDVFWELAAVVQTCRSGTHGDTMAENLLRFENGRHLVALGPDAARAIYYELGSRSLVAVRFDKHGVYEGRREVLVREVDEPGAWIEAYGNGLGWVRPGLRE